MKYIFLFLFFISTSTAFCQVTGKFKYGGEKFFPTEICLRKDSTFLYYVCMDKKHADGEYFETGIYRIQNDTLYLLANMIGFSCNYMSPEIVSKVAVLEKNNLYLLREDNSVFLRLRKKKNKLRGSDQLALTCGSYKRRKNK